jgi:hypothetical protein
MLRIVIAILLGLHGLIHALGFAATWQLGQVNAISSVPSFPSDFAPGSALPRLLGVLWLLLLFAFLGSAVGLAARSPWWKALLVAAAVVSLVLCLVWWNDAKFGLAIDVVILFILATTTWVVRPAG